MPSVFPSTAEQRAIVNFLDVHARQVHRIIRKKQHLIVLLNEQKQAIIHRAVTRGLNPNVRLKPSGIDWLGDVPERWIIKPLKRWVRINERTLPEVTDPAYQFWYLDISSVATGYLIQQPQALRFKGAPSRARRILRKGDTIVSTVRTYLKAVYYIAEEISNLIASTGFAVLTPGPDVEPEYLSFFIQSNAFIHLVTENSIGIAYPAIAESTLSAFHVVLPSSMQEQKEIADWIKTETATVNAVMQRAQCEINLLREYRIRLIADMVTGKLDVRNVRCEGGREEEVGWFEEGDADVENMNEDVEELTNDE